MTSHWLGGEQTYAIRSRYLRQVGTRLPAAADNHNYIRAST